MKNMYNATGEATCLPMKFCAVRKWKDGGEQVVEFFSTQDKALEFILRQKQPVGDEFVWCVGEF